MAENRYVSDFSKIDWGEKVTQVFLALYQVIDEVLTGLLTNTLPLLPCCAWGIVMNLIIISHWDYALFRMLHLAKLYPTRSFFYWSYVYLSATSGFWMWGLYQLTLRRKLVERLTDTFLASGLKNSLGRLPSYVSDRAIDEYTRRLRLTRANLPVSSFQKAKEALESSLQVFIDEIRENRENGTVDIIYSHDRMPEIAHLEEMSSIGKDTFVIGRTRSKQVTASLPSVPHLLVAGLTGGGKSTFLRQLITVLYLNNSDYHFVLADLKGGLEFQLFENLKRIVVVPEVALAITELTRLQTILNDRMALLKRNDCKDIDAYRKKLKEEKEKGIETPSVELGRYIVVVDEAAEMFLTGAHADASEIQNARRILSQIARQGRSVGVHLIVATQRPDAKALDPQVKANLTGIVCFQMANDASSLTVLGNGRATDLPKIPGRGLWKCGAEMVEVQTPYLSPEEVDNLLEKDRLPKEKAGAAPKTASDSDLKRLGEVTA